MLFLDGQDLRTLMVVATEINFVIASINRDDLTIFGELITAGKVVPVIDRRYPLTGTAEAMAYAEGGHARAKVVFIVDSFTGGVLEQMIL